MDELAAMRLTTVEPVSHDAGRYCRCVSRHVPAVTHVHRHHILPLSWGGPDVEENIEWLCQTTHENVHVLLREYVRYGGEPPWRPWRQQVSPFTRALAEAAWEQR